MESAKHIFRVDRREINYIKSIIESYDGMAVVRTIDPQPALIEIQMSRGCENLIFELLNSLVEDEGIDLIKVKLPDQRSGLQSLKGAKPL